jgi:hypothetical protein
MEVLKTSARRFPSLLKRSWIRIRIQIQTRIEVKNWFRIRILIQIKVMRIRNPAIFRIFFLNSCLFCAQYDTLAPPPCPYDVFLFHKCCDGEVAPGGCSGMYGDKIYIQSNSVSDPYSRDPDPGPSILLNPDPVRCTGM